MDDIFKEERFAHIIKDPKFRRIPKNERKVKIDKRFQSMFTDKKFSVNFTRDKRGRPCVQNSADNLRKYYDLSESEDETSDSDAKDSQETTDKVEIKKKKKKLSKTLEKNDDSEEDEALSHSDSKDSVDTSTNIESKPKEKKSSKKLEKSDNRLPGLRKDEKDKITKDIKQKLKNSGVDYARGDGALLSSSSEEESIYDSDEEDGICHDWGEFDKDAEEAVESTRRLAACNMDWDKIRAVDLMVSLNSFLPSGGVIHSVTIYPSEYGMERMKEEEVKGPIELVNHSNSDLEDNEEGSSYQMEKLRQYQLNRLKYYYAVIVCDSPETADKLWNECKNIEYESSGTKFDLRFIPDDMEFDQAPKEVCDQLPDFSTYQPRVFTTTALQQEKVDLTWDETNEDRVEITKKINSGKLDELNEKHLKYLIASGSSEDESDGEVENTETKDKPEENLKGSSIDKYKQLLKSIDEKEKEKQKKDMELECTWGFDAEERSKQFEKERQRKAESKTPFEEFLEKRKEKLKAKRKSKMEQAADKNSDASESEDDIPSDIDMNDSYFAEELKKGAKKDKKNKRTKNDKNLPSPDRDQQDELELILMDTDGIDNKKHFNMKTIEENDSLSKSKRKRLKRKNKDAAKVEEDDFKLNVDDDRFQALYTSHHFNIDPADNHFRKTKGTETLINEQLKRRFKNKN